MIKKIFFLVLCIFIALQSSRVSARYASLVIDAETGRVIHETEAAQRWYPASLTKVMTIYMTFSALQSGQLGLHDLLTVSKHAASQPSSKLGLRQGQTISVEHAIMAVTTRSANDAAVLLAETLGGSESNFAAMMTSEAKRLGMSSSSFQNASGLPDEGQISSARDLAILSLALIRDYPRYYPYFSIIEFNYKGRILPNTNRILKTYPDADGMKTGFTCGSGYNLIASAKRNGHRLIGVLLGAHSSAERFQQMGNLLDVGFENVKSGVNGMHVTQLQDDDSAPPPFQLLYNRCAGSAQQMGADTGGSSQHVPINIQPREKTQITVKHDTNNWVVQIGDDTRKEHAESRLNQARKALGTLSRLGQPQIVRVRQKKAAAWRTEWIGLAEADARIFCKHLHAKNPNCTTFAGSSPRLAASSHKKSGRHARDHKKVNNAAAAHRRKTARH